MDENGYFKVSLSNDAQGMLALYEAAHMMVVGEQVLINALDFAKSHLGNIANDPSCDSTLRTQINQAFKQPLRKRLQRLEATHYIPIYEQDASHNKILLKFAKLDFNQTLMLVKAMISSTRIPLNGSPRIFPLVRAAASIYRLITDDIVSHKKEQERGHVASSIECYQAETGASEEETVEYFSKQVEDAWKVIIRESLQPTGFPFPLVMPAINLARVIDTTYKGNDGLTRAGKDVKDAHIYKETREHSNSHNGSQKGAISDSLATV
nr:E-beta-farnesene synthase 1 [Tanacetum cinerariifolium]